MALLSLLALAGATLSAADEPLAIDLERAWPAFSFERPVYLTGARDGSGRVFVVEQAGKVWVFDGADGSETKSVFFDIESKVSREGNEEGLLGLAFHPRFADNGRFYVHYSSSVRDHFGTLSEFRVDESGMADPSTERVLLEVRQPYRNHNGGMVEFGPDGYLYLALGDGGAANDPHGHGQDLSTLLGTILRLDVDREEEGRAYGIPGDNPFVDVEDARPEIWAFGLRNVWRFSFDRATGALWAGDVGQNELEEISIVTRGGNYGWKAFEADRRFSDAPLSHGEHVPPVATYGRGDGISVTGGYVYRGARYPELRGLYVFADYVSGNLWTLEPDGEGAYAMELVRRTRRPISSFGEDDAGELFATSFDGHLYRVVPSLVPEGTFDDWPEKLSDTGIYASTRDKTLSADVVPYEVAAPFWSDGAGKRRYVQLPEGTALQYDESGVWDVPVGTTLVKEFVVPEKRGERHLETRLTKRTETGWEAATYVWKRTGFDARLEVDGKDFRLGSDTVSDGQWHAPSAGQCVNCHLPEQGFALGLRTAQMNTGDQLERLRALGLLTDFDAETAPRFVDPHGDEGTLEERARVWLDVNCAMCHLPDGPGNAAIDLRFGTALAATGMLDVPPAQGELGIEGARIVAPGAPERSVLLQRISTLDDARMPNVGYHRVDERGVALVRAWIAEVRSPVK